MGEVSVAVAAPSLVQGVPEQERLHRLPLLQHTTRSAAWLQLFAQLGLPANLALRGPRFDHFYMMIQAAAAGLGITLLPEFLVEQELRSGVLTRAIPTAVESDKAYWLAYPDEKTEQPPIKSFRDWLLAQISGAAT